MSENKYYVTTSDELYHYGVLGMKWGVRRNTRLLQSGDSAKQKKAAASLQKQREKGTAEIAKLTKKGVKLEQKQEKSIIKEETKAAKLTNKAAKHRRKAYGLFATKKSVQKHLDEALFLETKANALVAKAKEAKAKVNKNNAMISAFQREVNNIDSALVEYGRKYTNG